MNLSIQNLTKTYSNGVKALDNVTLDIPVGMYGLLGQNGAGKSSLMRTIATLQDADAGSIMLGDVDVLKEKDKVRSMLGYLPQEFGVYPKTSAVDMLDHLAVLKGFTKSGERRNMTESLLQKVNLWEHRKNAVASYSGGMKQRFGIAQALIGNPQLIIVDEPTAGLDPGERNRFYNLLSEIGENVIVILSTHIVQDVMELCNSMGIIHKGKVLYHGSPSAAVEQLEGKIWQKSVSKAEFANIGQQFNVVSNKLVAGKPLVHIYSEETPGEGFLAAKPDLEDVFFSRISAS